MLRGMASLPAGFSRFGKGDFRGAIPVVSRDELGDLARQANQMAQSLQRLESERSRIDWLRTAQSALSEQLRGELAPRQVAERAVSMLCRYLECPVGALYSLDADGALGLLGKYALSSDDGVQSFRLGEGLVGQAALQPKSWSSMPPRASCGSRPLSRPGPRAPSRWFHCSASAGSPASSNSPACSPGTRRQRSCSLPCARPWPSLSRGPGAVPSCAHCSRKRSGRRRSPPRPPRTSRSSSPSR